MGEVENRAVIDRLYDRVWIGADHDFDVRKLVVGDVAGSTHSSITRAPYDEVSIFEFRHGKIVRHTSYFTEPFEAPERRARWVKKM